MVVLVSYPDGFPVFDWRGLPRGVDICDVAVCGSGGSGVDLGAVVRAVLGARFGRLAEAVAAATGDSLVQLAALTLAWIYRYRPDPGTLRRVLPRDPRLRRFFEPLLYAVDEDERLRERRRRDEARRGRRRRLAERILSERGFGVVQRLAELYNSGVPVKELPARLGLPGLEHVYALLEYAESIGLVSPRDRAKRRGYRRLSRSEREMIAEMCRRGLSIYRIARETGRSTATVARICREARGGGGSSPG